MAKRVPTVLDQYWHKQGVCGLVSRAILRTLQFVFAITVAGLYGVDLAHATKVNTTAPAEWVYAEVVATFSAITCIVHCFVTVVHVAWSAWDGVLFVLWLSQTGLFGNIYISSAKSDYYQHVTMSVPRMRVAVWIDLVNMLLWFATFILGIAWCCRTRKITRRTDQLDNVDEKLMNDNDDQESALEDYRKELGALATKHATLDRKNDASEGEGAGAETVKQSKTNPDAKAV
ncbi:uncharacterized protein N7459_008325 [Penicillium hispanicum]|uniref:uncharacterized protein n=1 Tax=Penicillium hispanicum TaxID=1080232 RepID=UPI0025413E8C|nr:uncharacterized protein N7459_008325 [Penicillium hispanicum]KAJ5573898.1 hypothetical protein N7459_008325 [Penicillium hispanicum]